MSAFTPMNFDQVALPSAELYMDFLFLFFLLLLYAKKWQVLHKIDLLM